MNKGSGVVPAVGLSLLALALCPLSLSAQEAAKPAPPIAAMSALVFSPDGVLFVGDALSGAVFALDLGPRSKPAGQEAAVKEVTVGDVETRVGALIGTRADDVVVHDLAVDPLSFDIYLAISRNRGKWRDKWTLPNDIGNATELVKIDQEGRFTGVALEGVAFTRADLPKPVAPGRQHEWKAGVDTRSEAITDLAWDDGKIWVAGLSNEEFSSAIWRLPYPFPATPAGITTLENYHVAHQKWETAAPVRTLVAHQVGGKDSLIAAYLCTPLVVFPTAGLKDGAHVRGRTVSELGSGNFPLDMVVVPAAEGDRLLVANSALPLLSIKLSDIDSYEGEINQPITTYTAGVKGEYRPAGAVQQLDLLGKKHLVMLRRSPGGTLDLETWQIAR